MRKSFNLSNSSDMKKFNEQLLNQVHNVAKNSISNQSFNIECPKCKYSFLATKGINICPNCRNEIDLKLDFNF